MSINRSVTAGTDFPSNVKREMDKIMQKVKGICTICGKEHAFHYEHIRPIQWGGKSDLANCQKICPKCHDEKSKAEQKIGTDIAKQDAHIAKWMKKIFTPTGKRVTIRQKTIDNGSKIAKKVNHYKMLARKARRDGNKEFEQKCHNDAARWRRKK